MTATLDELKAQGVTDPDKQYDAVTVASIVQAEGGQAEYGDVAGAIYNRLKPNNTETNRPDPVRCHRHLRAGHQELPH